MLKECIAFVWIYYLVRLCLLCNSKTEKLGSDISVSANNGHHNKFKFVQLKVYFTKFSYFRKRLAGFPLNSKYYICRSDLCYLKHYSRKNFIKRTFGCAISVYCTALLPI